MFINIEQNTPEWLEYRRSKFNASEAGDVMGVGFNKPFVAYLKLCGFATIF